MNVKDYFAVLELMFWGGKAKGFHHAVCAAQDSFSEGCAAPLRCGGRCSKGGCGILFCRLGFLDVFGDQEAARLSGPE